MATFPAPETDHVLALDRLVDALQHVLQEVDGAVAGRLGTDQAATELEALPGEHAREMVRDALVLAEHEADLAGADSDVAGRHVDVGADVAVQLGHERLAESHHLVVGLALGVEVGAALRTTHRQTRQTVLERLLEGEELQHALGHRRVEPESALVRPDRVVVLHSPAALHADVAVVVLPADPEADDTIGLGDAPEDLVLVVLGLVCDELEDVLGNLADGLDELGLAGVSTIHPVHEPFEVVV